MEVVGRPPREFGETESKVHRTRKLICESNKIGISLGIEQWLLLRPRTMDYPVWQPRQPFAYNGSARGVNAVRSGYANYHSVGQQQRASKHCIFYDVIQSIVIISKRRKYR